MIGAGVHLYIHVYTCIYVYDSPKNLNGTLAVDLPFLLHAVLPASN